MICWGITCPPEADGDVERGTWIVRLFEVGAAAATAAVAVAAVAVAVTAAAGRDGDGGGSGR